MRWDKILVLCRRSRKPVILTTVFWLKDLAKANQPIARQLLITARKLVNTIYRKGTKTT